MIELEMAPAPYPQTAERHAPKWGKVLNQDTCIGCHACSTACKSEHLVPLGVNRTYVKQVEVGIYPEVSRQFQITRCNQCENPPCVAICPVEAMFARSDGIVDFDRDVCIGCKACIAACPYDAIFISPESHSAEKCNFCAHRIDQGLEPACVSVCPERAIVVGDLNDPESEISKLIGRSKVDVRKPEKGTEPKVMYVGASDYTLNPSKSSYENMHTHAEQREGYPVASKHAFSAELSVAAARLSYDVPHRAPWHWEVSLYTWTKSISAGVFLIFSLLVFAGQHLTSKWAITNAITGGVFLAITGFLLIADLEHPTRFIRIFTRPQWRSWLVRGSFLIAAYSLVLLLQFALAFAGVADNLFVLIPGSLFAVGTAVYTAFLFAQAKGRDLWQNPGLPLHLLAQAVLAGASVYLVLAMFLPLDAAATNLVRMAFMSSLLLHMVLVLSEMVIPHPTADGKKAAWQMISGRYRAYYWAGLLMGTFLPFGLSWFGGGWLPLATSMFALLGLLSYEHAYVQAGQSVPLS